MPDVIDSVINVFDLIGAWFVSFVPEISAIFWTPGVGEDEGSLTFMGTLALCGLAISVVFLVVGLIQNFLRFRA